MQQFDTRKTVDCKFFLFGTCTKGAACPFRHDPTVITLTRGQQAQQDCKFFQQGCCNKGSLCPFKHDETKLPALLGVGGLPGGAGAAAAAAPGRTGQQPITVDFGSSGSPDGVPEPTLPAVPSNSGPRAAQQPMGVGLRQATARAQNAQQQPAARAALQQPAARASSQLQQQPAAAPQEESHRGQPEQEGLGRSSVFSRLAGRLRDGGASNPEKPGVRQSPKMSWAARHRVAERAARLPLRRGGGALGVALSALQSVVVREASAEPAGDTKLQRTIVQDQPGRKRRMGSEEQSVKFLEDEVPAITASSPPRAKKAATAARLRPAATAAAPAAALAPMSAAPRPSQPAAASSGTQEQVVEFRPPKSLQELRKERQQHQQQRSSGSQEKSAQSPNLQQKAVHSRPGKHKPIQWQPKQPASQEAPSEQRTEAEPSVAAPSAAPQSTHAAAAPSKPPAQERHAVATAAPAAAVPPAIAKEPPAAMEPAGKAEEQGMEDASMDIGDEEFDVGEGEGGDEDLDDFEAQMRALEEQL